MLAMQACVVNAAGYELIKMHSCSRFIYKGYSPIWLIKIDSQKMQHSYLIQGTVPIADAAEPGVAAALCRSANTRYDSSARRVAQRGCRVWHVAARFDGVDKVPGGFGLCGCELHQHEAAA